MLGERVVSLDLVTSSVLRVITTLVGGAYHSPDISIEGGYYGCHKEGHVNLGWTMVWGAQKGGVGVCVYA
jgi:hypothetical protein